MPTYARYKPSKTQLTLTETKELLESYKRENAKLHKAVDEALEGLKFARQKLIEKENENRNLKLIILRLTEQGEVKKDG